MSFWQKIAGLGIKETLGGVGDLAKDIRQAITGDLSPEDKARLESRLIVLEGKSIEAAAKVDEIRGQIIIAEAQGESWLQRNWRPLLMLWFAGLVGAYWLGYTAPNLPETAVEKLLEIIQVGIGGYVLGRSAEKVTRAWKS